MSMQYCDYCDEHIDTNLDVGHFDSEEFSCVLEEENKGGQ